MKTKFFLIVAILAISLSSIAQTTNIPQLVNFSAIVRDSSNQPLINTPISVRLTFRLGGISGPLVYCALHQTSTNANGFMSLQLNRNVLGTGCNGAPSTAFENIPWDNGGFWMEVEYQVSPLSPFVSLGQLELASSFYSFASETAENVKNVSVSSTGDTLHIGGTSIIVPGISVANSGAAVIPTLTTTNQSSITQTTAISGGNITSNGGATITARGVCWSTNTNPTIANSLTSNGTGIGNFLSNITGLTAGTTYYVRAYATNSVGTAYGNEISFATLAPILTIGQNYYGGIVAYILVSGDPGYDSTVQHGLIVAPYDQSSGTTWGCLNTLIGGTALAYGAGSANTDNIVAGCTSLGIAARLCYDLVLGGYSDWYLPSQDELNKLYLNRVAIGGIASSIYWSSSEANASAAWTQNFTDGTQDYYNTGYKLHTQYVRAVRTF